MVQIFTGDSIHVILSTVNFQDFSQADIRRNKFDNLNINISSFISTGSCIKFLSQKFTDNSTQNTEHTVNLLEFS